MTLTPFPPHWVRPCLVLLVLSCALPFAGSTLILDVVRDLIAADGIARGESFPLRGPVFNAMMHLGPAWYYVLALPVALTHSVSASLLFVGILSALKFPLAYACGRRLIDWRFGIAWAAALGLPGWSLASAVIVTHTAVVETTVLLAAWFAVRLGQGGRPALWMGLGAAAGLAVHAHPSTVVLAPFLLPVFWQRRGAWRTDLAWIVAGTTAALALLVPVLVAEWQQGWPALEPLQAFARSRIEAPPQRVGPFLRGLFLDGPLLSVRHLSGGALSVGLALMLATVLAIALAGVVRALLTGNLRVPLGLLLAGLALSLASLFALRPLTPFYMVLVLLPVIAAVLGLGLAAWRSAPWFRVAIALATILSVVSGGLLLHTGARGLANLPAESIGNIRTDNRRATPVALLPAWQLDRLARDVCSSRDPVIVHGEVASLLENALFLSARWQCEGSDRIGIGGGAARDAGSHRLGLTPALAQRLGLPGAESWDSSWRQRPKHVIAARSTTPLAVGDTYPFRPRTTRQPLLHRWNFSADADDTVLVSHLFYPYDAARTTAVTANGKPQQAILRTNAIEAYRCERCTGGVAWQVKVSTPHPGRADIVIAD